MATVIHSTARRRFHSAYAAGTITPMPLLSKVPDLLHALNREPTAARGRALCHRFGRAALEQSRTSGDIHALLPRIYVHREQRESFRTRALAAMEWLPPGVALTGLAACAVHGLLEHDPPHLRAAAPSPLHVRSPRWLTLRRCIRPSTTVEIDGLRVVTVHEALVHAWEEDPTGAAREAIFAALREGKTSVVKIREALDYYPRVKGRHRFLGFLRYLTDGIQSWLEYVGARTVLNTPDLSCLKYQEKFVLEGHVFYADRYDPRSGTVVEFDSARWHGSAEARAYDAWRDELFRRHGLEPVRLPYLDVVRNPRACRAKVRATIAQQLAKPRAHAPP